MRFLCRIGLHKWKWQNTVKWRKKYTTLSMQGDVCQECGKHKIDPAKYTARVGLPQDYTILGPKEG